VIVFDLVGAGLIDDSHLPVDLDSGEIIRA
jgi:hypothetical protein